MASDTFELKVSVEEPRTWARRLKITVPGERVRRERELVVRRLAKQVRRPGFRKGRVPPHVVEREFGAAIDHEALERVVNEAYREAIERHQFQPISQGSVEHVDYSPGSDLTFDVEFEVRPAIELNRLGGFEIVRERPEVTDEDVRRVIERVREQQAVWHPITDEPPVNGDMVVVEITPAGKGAEGAKPRQYQLILGEGQAVPAVEEAIRTLTPGSEQEFTLELPDPEAGEAGATRQDRARIKLIEVKRPELPELDDEFARSVGDFADLEALRAAVREDLEREADAEAERDVRHKLLHAIIDANPFEVPDSMVERYVRQLIRPRAGADPDRIAEAMEMARPAAEHALRHSMVIERVAELEGLHATSAEVDARVEEIAERQKRPVAEVWAQLQKNGQLANIEQQITEDKVFEYLKSQSTIK